MIDSEARENAFRALEVEAELPPANPIDIADEPDPLLRQVKMVHMLRRVAAASADEVKQRRMLWEEQNRLYIDQARVCADDLIAAETKLREIAVTKFQATGDKAVCPGVSIRITTRLDYDRAEALQWAREHDMALSLDVKAFEGIAKAGVCGPLVTFDLQPQAMIATDLGKALAG